jgi:hypothetical protein
VAAHGAKSTRTGPRALPAAASRKMLNDSFPPATAESSAHGGQLGPDQPHDGPGILRPAGRGFPGALDWYSLACVSRQYLEFRLKDERVAEAIEVLGVVTGSGAAVIAAARAIRLVAFAAP